MKIENYKKNVFAVSILTFILLPEVTQSASSSCYMDDLQLVGIKAFCEASNGLSVSCFVNPIQVKKAYISCENGFYNDKNIQQQQIVCMDNGYWSEDQIKCIPECTNTPTTLKLIPKNKLKFPTSYVELVRKTPVEGKPNAYPGIIITARRIIVKSKHLDELQVEDTIIRIYKSKTEFIEHTFFSYICDFNSNAASLKYDEFCVLYISENQYIIYDEKTKPACKNLTNIPEFGETLFVELKMDYAAHKDPYAESSGGCYVPSVDIKKIDVKCYDVFPYWEFRQTECKTRAPSITKRCQIGFKNKKLKNSSDNRRDLLSQCHTNKWNTFGDDNDCEMICGIIDTKYRPTLTHLLYKGTKTDITLAPWHVGIYANNTEDSTAFEQICGGSIIHSNIVISAGHCFYDIGYDRIYDASNYLVGAGKKYRSYDISEPFEHYTGIKEIHIPTDYQNHPVANDIAVLILNGHFEYNSHIRPVCIDWQPYEKYNIVEGSEGYTFGWGATSREDPSSPELLTVNFTTMTNKQCRRHIGPKFRSEITGNKFCAVNNEKATACQGDSGGGFITRQLDEVNEYRYFLSGVISLGVDTTKYCSDGFLTVFTNLQFYQNLIKGVVDKTREIKPEYTSVG